MFDLSLPKLLVLAVIALVVFGPDELRMIAAQAGRALRDLRQIAEAAITTCGTGWARSWPTSRSRTSIPSGSRASTSSATRTRTSQPSSSQRTPRLSRRASTRRPVRT